MGEMLDILNSFYRKELGMKSDKIFFCSDKELILGMQMLCDECFPFKILVWNFEPCMFSKIGIKQMPRNQEAWLHPDHQHF